MEWMKEEIGVYEEAQLVCVDVVVGRSTINWCAALIKLLFIEECG